MRLPSFVRRDAGGEAPSKSSVTGDGRGRSTSRNDSTDLAPMVPRLPGPCFHRDINLLQIKSICCEKWMRDGEGLKCYSTRIVWDSLMKISKGG